MSVMDGMMDMMVGRLSVEERERMMLKMMPQMMKDIDLAEFMPKMMAEMLPVMFPLIVVELKKMAGELSARGVEITDLPPFLASRMLPLVTDVVDFEKLAEHKDWFMRNKMFANETVQEHMPKIMKEMLPGCNEGMLPHMSKEERMTYMKRVVGLFREFGCEGLSDAERKEIFGE